MFIDISKSLKTISDVIDMDNAYYIFTSIVDTMVKYTSYENLTDPNTKYGKFFELFFNIGPDDQVRSEVLFLLLYEYKAGSLDISLLLEYLETYGFSIKNVFEYLRLSSDIYIADRYYHYMKYLNQRDLELSNGTSKNLFNFISEKYDYAKGYTPVMQSKTLNMLYPNIEYHRSSSKFRNYREAIESYNKNLKNFIINQGENSTYNNLKTMIDTNTSTNNIYKLIENIFTDITSYNLYSDKTFLSLPNTKLDGFTSNGKDLRLFFIRYSETEREGSKVLSLYNNICSASDFLHELEKFLIYTITVEIEAQLKFSDFKNYIKSYYNHIINDVIADINTFKSLAFCKVIIEEFFEDTMTEDLNYITMADLLIDLSDEIVTYISNNEEKFIVKNALSITLG